MYIPSFNQFADRSETIAFMQRYSFATMVNVQGGLPVATHLPFLVEEQDDKLILSTHLAKANPHADGIIGCRTLVIFTEPHAYISPKHYEKTDNVPTWNYLAVHAYGTCILLDSEENKAALLEQTIKKYEADYLNQWNALPSDYKRNMIKGIVACQIVVDDLQAKKKLSQNRTEKERDNIIEGLSKAEHSSEKEIAAYMSALKKL